MASNDANGTPTPTPPKAQSSTPELKPEARQGPVASNDLDGPAASSPSDDVPSELLREELLEKLAAYTPSKESEVFEGFFTDENDPTFISKEDHPERFEPAPELGPSWWEGQCEGGIATLEELEWYVEWRLTHFISLVWSAPKALQEIGEGLGSQAARNAVRWLNRHGDPQPPTLTSADLAHPLDVENYLHRILRHIRGRQGKLAPEVGPNPGDNVAATAAQSPLPPVAPQEQDRQPKPEEKSADTKPDDAEKGLARCHHLAYAAYELAISRDRYLNTDRKVHDWLSEHQDLLDEYKLPEFDTFVRYLGMYRSAMGISKRAPRSGRGHGRSIVRRDQV